MIADSLAHAARYQSLHPLFPAAFDYLRNFPTGMPDGRHPIEGDRLFALVQSYETTPRSEKRFETHRRYIDIQYLLTGEELIYHVPMERLEVSESYQDERDATFFHDPTAASPTLLRAGDFTIYFPHDGHKGGCMNTGPMMVRKIVIKLAA